MDDPPTPRAWELLREVLALPGDAREGRLAELDEAVPELARQVRKLFGGSPTDPLLKPGQLPEPGQSPEPGSTRGPDLEPGPDVERGPDADATPALGPAPTPSVTAAAGPARGTVLGGRRLVRLIGRGALGTVHMAVPDVAGAGEPVAVKVIRPEVALSPGFAARFRREARAGIGVEHVNLLRTLDADVAEVAGAHHHYVVLEYFEGRSLRELLREHGRLPERLVRHLGREVARGLSALHATSAVHRDVRPENVVITRDAVVKLMDLGISRPLPPDTPASRTGFFVGSFRYSAPEEFADDDLLTPAADLYALGLLLFELATGVPTFDAPDFARAAYSHLHELPRAATELRPSLSPFLDAVLRTLLGKRPADRFAAADEVVEVLDRGEESEWWRRELRRRHGAARAVAARAVPVARTTAMYGRERQLGELDEAFERVRLGHGAVVLIEGDAGIGKTRLLDEFLTRLRASGQEFHQGYGTFPPGGAAASTSAFTQAFNAALGGGAIETALRRHLSDATGLAPLLERLLVGETESEVASALVAERNAAGQDASRERFVREGVETAFVHVTRSLARELPLVLLIDDLHNTNEAGLSLFGSLARALPRSRVLLVGTHRPAAFDAWLGDVQRMGHVARLGLAALGTADLSRLLVECLGSHASGVGLGVRVASKSGGNPYFVLEILRSLEELGLLARGPAGDLRSTQTIRDLPVPPSVPELLGARLQRLDLPDRELLSLATCLGHEFDPDVLASLVEEPLVPLLLRLGRLEAEHGLLRSAGSGFAFEHHALHETLYESLSAEQRTSFHARVARALAARSAGPEGGAAVEIAWHAVRGGRPEDALPLLAGALDHLEATYRHDEAVALCDAALMPDGVLAGRRRFEIVLRKAGQHAAARHAGTAITTLEFARSLAQELGDPRCLARAALALGRQLVAAEQLDDAQRRLLEAVGAIEAVRASAGDATQFDGADAADAAARAAADAAEDARLEAEALAALGPAHLAAGFPPKAKLCLDRALELAVQTGDRRMECRVRMQLGLALAALGRKDEAPAELERALQLARRLGDARLAAQACGDLGRVHRRNGSLKEAEDALVRHREQSRRLGDRRGEGVASANLGLVYRALGRMAEAVGETERALELAFETDDSRAEARAAATLGHLFRGLGQLDHAAACHERHIELCRRVGDGRGAAVGCGNVANVRVQQGRYAAALERHEQHLAWCRELGFRRGEAAALLNLGTLLAKLGAPDEAEQRLRESLDVAEVLGDPVGIGFALTSRGSIAMQRGVADEAEHHFDRALRVLKSTGTRVHIATVLLGLGAVQIERQRLDEARKTLDIALSIVEKIRVPELQVAAITLRARLPGGDPTGAGRTFREHEARLGVPARLQALRNLWFATGDARFRGEAQALLADVVAHAPEKYRESMLQNVPQYKAILEG